MPADHFQPQDCRCCLAPRSMPPTQLTCCLWCCCCCTPPHCRLLLVLQPSVTTSWRQAHPQLLLCRPLCLLLLGLAVCCWAQPLTLVVTRRRCCGGSGRRCWRWQHAARTHGSSHSSCQGGLTGRDTLPEHVYVTPTHPSSTHPSGNGAVGICGTSSPLKGWVHVEVSGQG